MTDQLALLWRKDSPSTSIEAGRSTDRARTRALVLRVLPTIQPATAEQVVAACKATEKCSESGVRTRLRELQRDGLTEECGTGKTTNGNPCALWRIASTEDAA